MFGWRHYECKYIIIYHKNWDCMLLPTLCPWSSMENFHPLHQTPHTLMRWNRQIAALSLHRTAPNLAHKKLCLIYWVHIQKYFVDFFSYFKNFADLSYMLTPLLLQPFSWPFWPSFTSHLCRETLVHRECRDPLVSNSVQAILPTPDAPWNSQRNHATRLNIFSVTCVFFQSGPWSVYFYAIYINESSMGMFIIPFKPKNFHGHFSNDHGMQAILCRMLPEILSTIMLLCWTYLTFMWPKSHKC